MGATPASAAGKGALIQTNQFMLMTVSTIIPAI